MADPQALKSQIREAFADVQYPGDWCLRGSDEGDEPYRVEAQFKGKTDWRKLDAHSLNTVPDGLASPLSFFSLEAFRFYLPAYLQFKHETAGCARDEIPQALKNYRLDRAGLTGPTS